MSLVAIRAGLETRLLAMPGGLSAANTQFELDSELFNPVSGQAYQRVWLMPAAPFNYGGVSKAHRLAGILQVDLCWPVETRSDAAVAADALAAWFPQGLSVIANSVTTTIGRTPEIKAGRVEG